MTRTYYFTCWSKGSRGCGYLAPNYPLPPPGGAEKKKSRFLFVRVVSVVV